MAVLAGLPFGARGRQLVVLLSIIYAVGIGAALVIRAVGPQLVGAISTVAPGWWLQTALLADYSSLVRIVLSGGFGASVYLAIVVGLFRLNEPIRVASAVVKDLIGRREQVGAGANRPQTALI